MTPNPRNGRPDQAAAGQAPPKPNLPGWILACIRPPISSSSSTPPCRLSSSSPPPLPPPAPPAAIAVSVSAPRGPKFLARSAQSCAPLPLPSPHPHPPLTLTLPSDPRRVAVSACALNRCPLPPFTDSKPSVSWMRGCPLRSGHTQGPRQIVRVPPLAARAALTAAVQYRTVRVLARQASSAARSCGTVIFGDFCRRLPIRPGSRQSISCPHFISSSPLPSRPSRTCLLPSEPPSPPVLCLVRVPPPAFSASPARLSNPPCNIFTTHLRLPVSPRERSASSSTSSGQQRERRQPTAPTALNIRHTMDFTGQYAFASTQPYPSFAPIPPLTPGQSGPSEDYSHTSPVSAESLP